MVLEKDSERKKWCGNSTIREFAQDLLAIPAAGGGGGRQIWKQTFINGQDFASSKAFQRYRGGRVGEAYRSSI